MSDQAIMLMTLGALLLLGLVTDWLGRRTSLPRITLLLLFGIVIGPSGLDLLAEERDRWMPGVAHMICRTLEFLVVVGMLAVGQWIAPAL